MKKKTSTHLNAALIVQRLPFHQQLRSSQTILIKCTPVWQNWVKHNLHPETANAITLSHFQNGELILHCHNAISATQIKQQQQTLLVFFSDEGITDIKKITVRIANQSISSSDNKQKNQINTTYASDRVIKNFDNNALNSIKSIQKNITNDALSESLNRLIHTIEQIK